MRAYAQILQHGQEHALDVQLRLSASRPCFYVHWYNEKGMVKEANSYIL